MSMSDKELNDALAAIEKAHGKGAIMKMGDKTSMDIEVIPTGDIALDLALGVGGLPKGRVTEIYGPESCLDADTFVQFEVRKGDLRQNHKGGTIESLYHRFNNIPKDGTGGYLRPETRDSEYFLPCMNEDGRVFQNRIEDVLDVGVKPCLTVKTVDGLEITATADHKFFSGGKFLPLSSLIVGDSVTIHNQTRFKNDGKERDAAYSGRLDVFLAPVHPNVGIKTVRENGHEYRYSRIAKARAVYEAHVNGLSLDEYKKRFVNNDLSGMIFLDVKDHVHHLDEDCTNDDISNLVLISASEHGRLHALERHNNLRYMVVEDIIESIEPAGDRHVYDIRMMSPFNNYIADGFVVHNSGKTTLAMHVVAEAQKLGGICAYVDAEHAVDPVYAAAIGVDVDELLISQPDTGEQALEIVDTLIRSNSLAVIVVDSVAALTPRAEIEGDMGDSHMGLQARLMSQAMRKITAKLNHSHTVVIFINQLREKIGVMFGSPETTPGGRALKFYSSVRLDIRRIAQVKDGVEITGNRTRVKVVKNKVAPPFQQAEFDIMYGEGISLAGSLIDMAVEFNIVNKSGAWYSYDGEQLGQGREVAKKFLTDNPDVFDEINSKVRVEIGLEPSEEEDENGNED
jgi:recombination protein RecA